MKMYVSALRDGTIPPPDGGRPDGMTLSGLLALLHKAGPKGLASWNTGKRFPQTEQLVDSVNGIF
jgi:hypothetical protein